MSFVKLAKCMPKERKVQFFRSFCASSSIHGFKYVLQKKVDRKERILWAVFILAAFITAVNISTRTVLRFLNEPTVVTIERDAFTWNTTFPAITICPVEKINYELLDRYLDFATVDNQTLLREFLIRLAYADYTNFEQIPHYDLIVPDSYMELLLEFQYDFGGVVTASTESENRALNLIKIVSEMGICYSFNSELALYNSPE